MTFLSVIFITLILCGAVSYIWTYYRRKSTTKETNISDSSKMLSNYLKKYQGTSDDLLFALNYIGSLYPSPFALPKFIGMNPFVVIYKPEQVKIILQSQHCLGKSEMYKFGIFGIGLLTASESVWNQSRKIMTPSFNPNVLQGFFNIFIKQSLILKNELEKVGANGNEIIFLKYMKMCALEIAFSTIISDNMESNKKDEYFKMITRLKEILKNKIYLLLTRKNITSYIYYFNTLYNFTASGQEQRQILKSIKSLINEIIQQQQQPELNKIYTTKTENHTNHKTFLDILKKFKNKDFTDEIIYDNLITLLTLTSDTISATVDFVVFMLANFPKIQEKVYKELTEIYGTETLISAPVKYDDLQHMHYLDQVIKETMRLFPTIPIIGRQLTKDVYIGDSTLQKNTNVIISLMLMNRKEQYWPNALKFDPDRFHPERMKDCSSYYYIPFSDGPRNCISTEYAMISMKVILATLIRTFVFKVDNNMQMNVMRLTMNDLTLSTVKPLKIKIKKRDI
ncbi:cytochrome P450 4V2 [Monomorium pharaonis]|uniref:cytochrome P450 4V2 n=1 Tax=Monomorium pharaonis TaxID=307658 RepID=UPI00063EE671|nr:cytochrome P450 4V2 [Monomorium pharaonis]